MNAPTPPGTLAVARRLAALALRRRWNRFTARRRRRRGEGRQAVGRARGGLSPGLLLVGLFMVAQSTLLSATFVKVHAAQVELRAAPASPTAFDRTDPRIADELRAARVPDWPAPERMPAFLIGLGTVLTCAFLALFFIHLSTGNQDLGQAGWDLEWLFTFPVPARGLFLAKLGELVFADAMGWAVLAPFLVVVTWRAGYGAWGIPLGLAGALCLLSLLGSMRLAAETWLRKRLARAALKNVQAIASVLGILLFFAVFLVGVQPPGFLFDLAAALPPAALAVPWTAPLLLPLSSTAALLAPLEAVLAVALALGLAGRLVRDGLLVSGGSAYGAAARRAREADAHRSALRGIAGKEVRLLLRDRNLFVQMLVIPLLIVGFQLLANPSLRAAGASPRTAAVLAFGVGAYVLMFGAFSVLYVERDALWLLFTFPQRLGALLRRKVRLWAGVALLYALGALALAWRPGPDPGAADLLRPLLALVALPVFAQIAAGLGTLGTDPFQQRPSRRIAPQWVYLYSLLAAGYGWTLVMGGLWSAFVLLVLLVALAWAIWQKADDRLPVLLDPVVQPVRRLSLPDGLIAALCFFVLQGVLLLLFVGSVSPRVGVLLAYVLAGFLVAVGARISLSGSRALGASLQAMGLGRGAPPRALLLGALAGVAAALVGLGWVRVVEAVPALRALRDEAPTLLGAGAGEGRWAIVLLAVVAAPLFEEYVFRGLLLGGMLRSIPPRRAVLASALVFAVVHPPLAAPAVLGLGIAAGLVFVRTRVLWACVAAHAAYNGIVVLLAG